MSLSVEEKRAIRTLEKSIIEMKRTYDSLDPATNYKEKMDAGSAYRKLVNAQSQLQQEALAREIPFKESELKQIEDLGDDIKKAAKTQERVAAALALCKKVVLKAI